MIECLIISDIRLQMLLECELNVIVKLFWWVCRW